MDQVRNSRSESRHLTGKFRGGRMFPAACLPMLGGEGGVVTQTIVLETDPVVGKLITQMHAEVITVFAPVEAIHALLFPDDPTAGITEVVRQKLLSGAPLFGLENEGDLTKMMGVQPQSIAGAKKVNVAVRVGHNAAINYIRRNRYAYAAQLLHNSTAMTPALISAHVLQRMNGVLDPDDHINGAVQLSLPTMSLPVSGIGMAGTPELPNAGLEVRGVIGSDTESWTSVGTTDANFSRTASGAGGAILKTSGTGAAKRPEIYAELSGVAAGGISLTDFDNAKTMDRLTRTMRNIIDANPSDGEDAVLRWAHGMTVDRSDSPFILHSANQPFKTSYQMAGDGTGMMEDVALTRPIFTLKTAFPVPHTELGGILFTFIAVKPDEVLDRQPHPILSEPWGMRNHVADQLKLDPEVVTQRQMFSDVPTADETKVAFYSGFNERLKRYVNYGFNRFVDPELVESRNALWQYAIPTSVTPDNIIYPQELEQFPFPDQDGDIVTYAIEMNAVIQTPVIFGPTPVETIDVINDEDIFEENP